MKRVLFCSILVINKNRKGEKMNIIVSKINEVVTSVAPIVLLVFILHAVLTPIESQSLIKFIIGTIVVIMGLTTFLIGVDIGITPLGDHTGKSFAKANKLWLVLLGGVVLGFFISIAEPGLMVLANQVSQVTMGVITNMEIVIVVSIGLALLLAVGFLRIFYSVPLFKVLLVLYISIAVLSLFASKSFLAIAFDASGSTTGILAVPFILSLSVGISKLKKDSKASEKDSFGLVAIASTGAIISVLLLDILLPDYQFATAIEQQNSTSQTIITAFVSIVPQYLYESALAILPLLVILLILQKWMFHLKKREMRKILTGFIFSFIGLSIFLIGVNAGFMDVATSIGSQLALNAPPMLIMIVGVVLGVVTILAEPAVYVLTQQIEDVTSGYVKKMYVLIMLAIGVGLAVGLSVLRIIVSNIQLWHYILPGYLVALGLMFVTPKLFVGIAFDAGGVATGPMTATFILAFIQGIANSFEGADLMADGFGMIAMVALMPIITLEILGVFFAIKSKQAA